MAQDVNIINTEGFIKALMQELPKPVFVKHDKEDRADILAITQAVIDMDKHVGDSFKELSKIIGELKKLRGPKDREAKSSTGSRNTTTRAENRASTTTSVGNRSGVTLSPTASVAPRSGSRTSMSSPTTSVVPRGAVGDPMKYASTVNSVSYGLTAVATGFAKVLDSVGQSAGVNIFKDTFTGILADEFAFTTGMRKIVAETSQIGVSFKEAEKMATGFGDVVNETGNSRLVFEQGLITLARKGYTYETNYIDEIDEVTGKTYKKQILQARTIKDQQKLLKNTLATSFAIGSSAQGTAEVFGHWQKTMGLTNGELFNLGINMKMIAHETGVSGDNLLQAAKASEDIINNLKARGGLNAETAARVIEGTVIAAKLGIEDLNKQIEMASTSNLDFMKIQDPKMRSLFMEALQDSGLTEHWIQGTLPNKSFERDQAIAGTMQNRVNNVVKSTGVSSGDLKEWLGTEHIDIKDLSSNMQQLARIQEKVGMNSPEGQKIFGVLNALNKTKETIGINAWEIEKLGQKAAEQKTPEQKMQDLQGKLEKAQKGGTTEQIANLKKEMANLQNASMSKILTSFSDQSKYGVEGAAGTAKLSAQKAGLGNVGIEDIAKKTVSWMEQQSKELGLDYDKNIKEAGFKDSKSFEKALTSKDGEARKQANDLLQKMQNEITTKSQTTLDPVMEIKQNVASINEGIKKMTNSWIMSLSTGVLEAIIVAGFSASVFSKVVGLAKLKGLFDVMLGGMKGAKIGEAVVAGGEAVSGAAKAGEAVVVGGEAVSGAAKAGSTAANALRTTTVMADMGVVVEVGAGAAKGVQAAELAAGTAKVGAALARDGVIVAEVVSEGSKAAGMFAKFLGPLRMFGNVASKIALPLMVVMGVIDGVRGIFSGWSNTAKNFADVMGKGAGQLNEVTTGMKASSAAAGAVTGVLNGLSLGLLGFFGAVEPVEKFLSKVFYTVVKWCSDLWEGFKEGFLGGYNSWIKPALERMGVVWDGLKNALSEAGNAIADLVNGVFGTSFKGMGDMFTKLWAATEPYFKGVGAFFGYMAGGIGGMLVDVLNGVLVVITALIKGFTFLIKVITPFCNFIKNVVVFQFKTLWDVLKGVGNGVVWICGLLKKWFGGLWDVIAGVFTLDGKRIWEGIKSMFSAAGEYLWGVFKGVFVELPKWLGKKFLESFEIFKKLWEGIKDLVNWVLDQMPGGKERRQNKELAERAKGQGELTEKNLQKAVEKSVKEDTLEEKQRKLGSLNKMKKNEEEEIARLQQNKPGAISGWWTKDKTDEVIASHKKMLDATNNSIDKLQKDAATSGVVKNPEAVASVTPVNVVVPPTTDAENMKISMGKVANMADEATKKNSIFVHDTHCEALLMLILEHLGGATETDVVNANKNYGTIEMLSGVLQNKAMVTSSVKNTGAFDTNVLDAKVASLVGVDLNNITSSQRSEAKRGTGGVSHGMYFSDDEEYQKASLDLNGKAAFAAGQQNLPSSANVSASMYTPEDAADFVYQQLRGSVPDHASMTGTADGLLDFVKNQQYKKLCEIADELRNLRPDQMNVARQAKMPNGELSDDTSETTLSLYDRDMLRGNWPGLQFGSYSTQHNATGNTMPA